MCSNYKVSILVPIYGVEKYIERCANSIFGQSYENIEYIFVDDCTPDNSIRKLKAIIKKYPNRENDVKIIRHVKNRGLAAARNTAVAVSSGEFIMHVDSDDWIDNDLVEKLVCKQKEKDADIVSCDAQVSFPDFETVFVVPRTNNAKDFTLQLIHGSNRMQVWGRIYRRSLYVDNHIQCREGLNMAEDFQVTPLLSYYSKKVDWVENVYYHYEMLNPGSYMMNWTENKLRQTIDSRNLVYKFFADKGDDYVFFCELSYARSCVDYLKCALANKFKDQIVQELRTQISELSSDAFMSIPLCRRLIYYLRIKIVCRLYIRIGEFIRHKYMNIVRG